MDAGDAERLAEWEGDDEGGEVRGVEDDAAGPEMGEVEVVGVGAGVAEGVDKETGVCARQSVFIGLSLLDYVGA